MQINVADILTESVDPKDQASIAADYYLKSSSFGYFQVAIAFIPLLILQYLIGILPWGWALTCAIASAVVAYRMTIIIHDCCHYTLFEKRTENKIFGWLASSFLFTNYALFRRMHWIHHKHFRRPIDPQGSDYNGLVPGKDNVIGHLLKPLVFLNFIEKFSIFNTRVHSGVTKEQLAQAREKEERVTKRDKYLSLSLIGLMQLISLLLTTHMFERLWGYPLYMICLVSIGLFLSRLRSYLEHGTIEAEDADKLIARTHVSNVVERNLLAAIYFNYHNEHHRWPQVPSYLLPKLYQEITMGRLPERDFSPSYWNSLKRIVTLSLKRKPS